MFNIVRKIREWKDPKEAILRKEWETNFKGGKLTYSEWRFYEKLFDSVCGEEVSSQSRAERARKLFTVVEGRKHTK